MEAATQHIFDLAEQYERTVLLAPAGGNGSGTNTSSSGAQHGGAGLMGLDDNGEELIEAFEDKLLLP